MSVQSMAMPALPPSMPKLPDYIAALLCPDAYHHPTANIRLVETHISYVLLTGDFVYKIKKPVTFSFVDYHTLERRRHFCRREVALNRVLAPDVYYGVVTVRDDNGSIRIGQRGRIREYAVKMRQIPAEQFLTTRIATGRIMPEVIDLIAERLVMFYRHARTGPRVSHWGSPQRLWENARENFVQMAGTDERYISAVKEQHIERFTATFLKRADALLRKRVAEGFVRDGHGDLRAEHIFFADDPHEPADIGVIDRLEFGERYRCGDVAADLAFLDMDLRALGRPDLAERLISAYVGASNDFAVRDLLPYYGCYRAYVRGKVESLRAEAAVPGSDEQRAATLRARQFFDLAFVYAGGINHPALVLMAGLMGVGKTTLARELAQRSGATVISSDVVRKELAQIAPSERRLDAYNEGIYTPERTAATYAAMLERARQVLATGMPVILDASFKRAIDRAAARQLAQALGVPLLVIECVAPEEVVRDRLMQRLVAEGSVSDGRWELYAHQRADFEPVHELPPSEHLVIDTTHPLAICADRAEAALRSIAS